MFYDLRSCQSACYNVNFFTALVIRRDFTFERCIQRNMNMGQYLHVIGCVCPYQVPATARWQFGR